MHRQLTLILALSLLFTVLLPTHALAGGVESNINIARMHNRMLRKRGSNPLGALLGDPDSQAPSGDGGAANVESAPTAQPQNDNPSSSDNTNGGSSAASSQTGGDGGATTGGGSGTGSNTNPSTGGTNTGNTGGTGGTSNGDTNQSGNSQASNSQQGSPLNSIVNGILGSPASPTKSVTSPDDTPGTSKSLNSTASATNTSTSSTSTSSTASTSSTPSTTPTSSSSPTSTSSSTDVTTTTSTSSSTPSQTAPSNDDSPSSSSTITKNTIIILVAIGASVGAAAIIWTVIRKWKFRPSSNFEGRMQPIDWQPTTHDDDGAIADRLARNASTRSHGSFTSGTGHSGANDNSLVADLPPLDSVGGPGHLAPVGGYANLQRGPSPQPMYELANPHHYPVSQQPYYNAGQGTAYGY